MRRFRTRHQVRRGGGSLQVAEDDRGGTCFVCEEGEPLFLQFNSPRRGDRMFLRLCRLCLATLQIETKLLPPLDQPTPEP